MSPLILPDAPHLWEIAFSGAMECTFEFIIPGIYDYVLQGGFAVVFCSRVRYVPLQGLPFFTHLYWSPKILVAMGGRCLEQYCAWNESPLGLFTFG